MPHQAYFEVEGVGDWYECIEAASPGESPAVAPAKWRKLEWPAILEAYLVDRACALLLSGDGQQDKRRSMERSAVDQLDEAIFAYSDRGDFQLAQVGTR